MIRCFILFRMMLGTSSIRFTSGLRSDLSVPLHPTCVSRCMFFPYLPVPVVVLMRGQGNKENRSIINVSSVSGLHGNVGQANYAAAKAAVVGLTKTIAKEWGPFGVRANTIAFGLVHTRSAFGRVPVCHSSDADNRLTQSKEEGAIIEIDGKKVALGIPGTGAGANQPGPKAYPLIPLARGASPDEAANGMLL